MRRGLVGAAEALGEVGGQAEALDEAAFPPAGERLGDVLVGGGRPFACEVQPRDPEGE
jgi:hypothetical protein